MSSVHFCPFLMGWALEFNWKVNKINVCYLKLNYGLEGNPASDLSILDVRTIYQNKGKQYVQLEIRTVYILYSCMFLNLYLFVINSFTVLKRKKAFFLQFSSSVSEACTSHWVEQSVWLFKEKLLL